MKCLSLTQPWASLVALGAKRIETRSWWTSYRGEIAIQATKEFPAECRALCEIQPFQAVLIGEVLPDEPWHNLPTGSVVAVVDVLDCFEIQPGTERAMREHHYSGAGAFEADFGDYTPGRYGWALGNLRTLRRPVPVRGRQRIFNLSEAESLAVADELVRTLVS